MDLTPKWLSDFISQIPISAALVLVLIYMIRSQRASQKETTELQRLAFENQASLIVSQKGIEQAIQDMAGTIKENTTVIAENNSLLKERRESAVIEAQAINKNSERSELLAHELQVLQESFKAIQDRFDRLPGEIAGEMQKPIQAVLDSILKAEQRITQTIRE